MDSVTQLLTQNLGAVAIVLFVLVIAALAVAVANAARIRSISGRFAWVTGEGGGSPDTLDALLKTVESNQRTVGVVKATLEQVIEENKSHLKRVGLIRYNAFEGVAGHQSYSLCLLDEHLNGVLVSSLVGNQFSRSYAVEISEGQPSRKLGDEETIALRRALGTGD